MAILYPGRLPAGALIETRPTTLAPAPSSATLQVAGPAAPIWFTTATAASLDFNDQQRVIGWRAAAPSTACATPVSFNETGTGWDAQTARLEFTAKTHGGLCITGSVPAAVFSLGLIYTPAATNDAQTLFSLQAQGEDAYGFVCAEAGALRFGLKGSDVTLSLPDPRATALLLFSSDGAKLRMSVNGEGAVSTDCALTQTAMDLFIGCRGGARSLLGKLGSFMVSDVLIWPDADVHAGPGAAASAAALSLWQERVRNGHQA